MRIFVARLIGVVVLVAVAIAVRQASTLETRIATAQEQLTTVGQMTPAADANLDASASYVSRVPVLGEQIARTIRRQRAEAAYWRADYAALTAGDTASQQAADPSLRLLAANAAYRTAVIQQRTNQALAKSLEEVLKGYAGVLTDAPELTDAAYNYEYVVRLRNAAASGKSGAPPGPKTPPMQGEKGEPPEGTKKSDFKVIVPLRPEERQEQLDPAGGADFKRKG